MNEDMVLAFGPYWAWKVIAVLFSPMVLVGTWSEIWRAMERRRQSGPHPSAFRCTSILADVAGPRDRGIFRVATAWYVCERCGKVSCKSVWDVRLVQGDTFRFPHRIDGHAPDALERLA